MSRYPPRSTRPTSTPRHSPIHTHAPTPTPTPLHLSMSTTFSRPYLSRLILVTTLGGLLFGLDTGIASGMLVSLKSDLGGEALSSTQQGIFVGGTTAGAIGGSAASTYVAERWGRKKAMLISSIFFLLGSIEQSASQVFRELVLGRVLVGLGVGMASMVIPIYLAECAPSDLRGRIVGSNSALVTGGQVTAYAISAAFYHLPHSWRWMVLTGAPPALAQLVGLWALDESPRWLLHKGKHAQARRALARMYPSANDDQIEEHLRAFELSSSSSEQEQDERRTGVEGGEGIAALVGRSSPGGKDGAQGIRQLLADRSARKALLLACGLQASQQLVGANS
ncbi:MFS general substrate transporter, partial [Ceraceosorus guamensis]